jgi:hypothetical protein
LVRDHVDAWNRFRRGEGERLLRRLPTVRPTALASGVIVVALILGFLPLDFETIRLLAAVGAVAAVLEFAVDGWRGYRSARWPIVPGRITRAWSSGGRRPVPQVRYEYAIGDERFEGRRIRFASVAAVRGLFGRAGGVLDRYPVGHEVAVAYDPRSPRHAVLEPGLQVGPMVAVVTAVAAALGLWQVAGFDLGIGPGFGVGSRPPEQRRMPDAEVIRAAADPTVVAAAAECFAPSAAEGRAALEASAETGVRPTSCFVGYVSAASWHIGPQAVVYLDDLDGDPARTGVAVLVTLGDLPAVGSVARAWGWVRPADEFPCDRVEEPCLMATPLQFSVLLTPS